MKRFFYVNWDTKGKNASPRDSLDELQMLELTKEFVSLTEIRDIVQLSRVDQRNTFFAGLINFINDQFSFNMPDNINIRGSKLRIIDQIIQLASQAGTKDMLLLLRDI
jgi:hypothetical protein